MGYRNPVLRGVNADPSVCRRGGDYYLATSSMDLEPGLPVYQSRDLVNWRLVGHALAGEPGCLQRPRVIFAPTIRHHGGHFYLVSTDVAGGGNFLLRAGEPEGPWEGPFPIDADSFDPSICFTSDGRCFYTRRGRIADKDIVQAEIDPSNGRLVTPLRSIATGFVSDDAEGPHLYEIGGVYFLVLAEGGSRALHMVTVGRSDSPWGPFEPCPWNPIVAQHHAWWDELLGAGHGELVEAHDGSWWITFLATRHPSYEALSHLGRETFLAPVSWRDGWPWVDPEATRRLDVRTATLPLVPQPPVDRRDDFDAATLKGCWVTVASHATPLESEADTSQTRQRPGGAAGVDAGKWWSLQERRGQLRLLPGSAPRDPFPAVAAELEIEPSSAGRPSADRRQALLVRRQEDLTCAAVAALDADPADGEEAGLCVFQTASYRYDIVVARRLGRRVAFLRRRVLDLLAENRPVDLPPGLVRLRVDADPDRYRFSVTDDSGASHHLGSGATRLISSELAGAWSGALIGVWAAAPAGSSMVADVDWFDYQGQDEQSCVDGKV